MQRIILLLVLLISTLFGPVPLVQAAEPVLKQAQDAIDAGKYEQAVELADRAIKDNPSLSEAWRLRANAKRMLADWEGARRDYTRAIELDPKNYKAFGGRALARLEQKDYQGAQDDLNRAFAINPDYSTGHAIQGDIYWEKKEYKKSYDAYERATSLNPKAWAAWVGRGNCHVKLGDYRAAVSDYDRAEALNPSDGAVYYNRALALEALGNPERALKDFARSIECNYRVAEAHCRRGDLLRVKGDVAGARQEWALALKKDPKMEVARKKLAETAALAESKTATKEGGTKKSTVVFKAPDRAAIPGLAVNPPVLSPPKGELWSAPSSEEVTFPTDAPPLAVPVSDPAGATRAIPLAELGFAQEGLKALVGPLSAQEERAWSKKWQPFFDYPSPEILDYFRKLNPILSEVQVIRATVNQAAQDFDAAWAEAVISHAVGDDDGAASALAQAARHSQVIRSAGARMVDVQKRVQSLGNPPDPIAAKAKAREWSRKWTQTGDNLELAKYAYLWRVAQSSARNSDGRFAASMAGRSFTEFWPADEDTWCRWLVGGKQGPEPGGPNAPSQELVKKANDWTNRVYDTSGVGPCLKIHFFQNVPADVAARQILAKGKVRPWRLPGFVHDDAKCLWCKGKEAAVAPPPAQVAETQDSKAQREAELKAKQETIAEKEDLIRLIRRNLERDEAEWAREKDPQRKEELYLRVLNNRSAIQHERDLIQSLKTGEYVHTRTPSEEYCHDLMIVRTVEHMKAVDDTRRLAAAVERMAGKAEPDQVEQLRDFVERQITPKDLAEGNSAKVRQVAKAVFDSVQGRREQAVAKHLEEAIEYEDYELRAQRVKTISTLTLMVAGTAAPLGAAGGGTVLSAGGTSEGAVMAVNALYGASTGTIEGGPVEGIKQAAAMVSMTGFVASEMMTGYERGGLVTSGGVAGALERGVAAFMGGKLVEGIAGKAGAWWAGKARGNAPVLTRGKPGLTVDEFIEGQSFQLAKNTAQHRINEYRETARKLAAARAANADAAEIAALEAKRLQQATKLNDDFLAKRILKAEGKASRAGRSGPEGAELEQDFVQAVETIQRTQVDPAFQKAVNDAGYHWRKKTPGGSWQKADDLRFKDMRHGDTGKTVNTDRDLALEEMQNSPGEVYQLYKGDKPVNLSEAEKDLQEMYNRAYEAATGGNPRLAMQNITTSRSREAYKDLAYTHLNDPANIERINKGWAGQATEVLQYKVTHAGAGQGELSTLIKKIDGANQAAKDIDKRLLPLLKAGRAKATGKKAVELDQDIERWLSIQKALEGVERNPVTASRQLRVLTGLDGIGEVTELVEKAFLGAAKML
ncbi:MAG: tetratricopeptide repeat protein [Syntrophobacterales bacterium]|nr:tetratricopeptide repeat protein [Syntrophobacterales bacterium]